MFYSHLKLCAWTGFLLMILGILSAYIYYPEMDSDMIVIVTILGIFFGFCAFAVLLWSFSILPILKKWYIVMSPIPFLSPWTKESRDYFKFMLIMAPVTGTFAITLCMILKCLSSTEVPSTLYLYTIIAGFASPPIIALIQIIIREQTVWYLRRKANKSGS